MKKMPKPRPTVEDLLADIPRKPLVMDQYPELVDALVHFLDLKSRKDPRAEHIKLEWFYLHKLKPTYGGPSVNTVRVYLRTVLRRDWLTGNPL